MTGDQENQNHTVAGLKRREFLRSTAVGASVLSGLSVTSSGSMANRTEFEPMLDSIDKNSKPLAIKADIGTSYGVGGYNLHNSGQLAYLGSSPVNNSLMEGWLHSFSIEGFGFTTGFNGHNNGRDYFFGDYPGGSGNHQPFGQALELKVGEDVQDLMVSYGNSSSGWYKPNDLWDTFKSFVDSTSNYSTEDIAEELHYGADIGTASKFYDSEYEAIEGEVEQQVEQDPNIPEDEEETYINEAVMTAIGIGTTFIPGPAGTAISVGSSLAHSALLAKKSATGNPDDFDYEENEEKEVGDDFDNRVRYPKDGYLTIVSNSPPEFENPDTPMRGHQIVFSVLTSFGDSNKSYSVTIRQKFDGTGGSQAENSMEWTLELPTEENPNSACVRDDVQSRVKVAMQNIDANFISYSSTDINEDSDIRTNAVNSVEAEFPTMTATDTTFNMDGVIKGSSCVAHGAKFEYRLDGSDTILGRTSDEDIASTPHEFEHTINGLEPSTEYEVRLVVENSDGERVAQTEWDWAITNSEGSGGGGPGFTLPAAGAALGGTALLKRLRGKDE